MNLARILYPVKALGPGERIGLWLCGCSRRCKGCSNPELWERRREYEISPEKVFSLIADIFQNYNVDGFTISGGEPFDQPEELSELIRMIKVISNDILIYTGYRIEELYARKDRTTDFILRSAAVLIDGEYIKNLNNDSVIRGSENQKIHILNKKFSEQYRNYISAAHNQIQNFTTSDGIVSVGIHHPSF